MEKKNMVLLTVIAVATLLVAVVGATFAYFTASIQNNYNQDGSSGTANISSGTIEGGSTVVAQVSGQAGSFTATDVYPGHKEVAALQVTVTDPASGGTGIDITYDLTNLTFSDDTIRLTVYRNTSPVEIGATTENNNYLECNKQVAQGEENEQKFFETCNEGKVSGLGKKVSSTDVLLRQDDIDSDTPIVIGQDKITENGAPVYYYIVAEFVDSNANQASEMGKTLEGNINVRLTP